MSSQGTLPTFFSMYTSSSACDVFYPDHSKHKPRNLLPVTLKEKKEREEMHMVSCFGQHVRCIEKRKIPTAIHVM